MLSYFKFYVIEIFGFSLGLTWVGTSIVLVAGTTPTYLVDITNGT